tara:strand:- start:775 stop:957 length:183 start_codon:yes stop_codon:yes gene_type:complete
MAKDGIVKKEVKKKEVKVDKTSNNALDTRIHLLEKDLEHLFKNVIEMQKDLRRVLDRMGL